MSTIKKTIQEEVQEAMIKERKKTAIIVRGIAENGNDKEAIHQMIQTLGVTEMFQRIPKPTRLGKNSVEGRCRPIRNECDNAVQKYDMHT